MGTHYNKQRELSKQGEKDECEYTMINEGSSYGQNKERKMSEWGKKKLPSASSESSAIIPKRLKTMKLLG